LPSRRKELGLRAVLFFVKAVIINPIRVLKNRKIEKNYKKSEKISKDGLKDLLFFAFYITMERAKKRKMLSRLYKSGDGRAFCV
jgi:hypothetical protein